MHTVQLLSALLPFIASSTLAAPTLQSRGIPVNWGLQAIASTKPVHLQFVSASNRRFFIGNATSSYCPTEVVDSCPPGKDTVFSGESGCGLDVNVPGGQQVFITPQGELGYTAPHSASIPQDSAVCPFVLDDSVKHSSGANATVSTTVFGANGLMACPTTKTPCGVDAGPYQVFANMQNATVPNGDVKSCIPFSGLAYDYGNKIAAWEYS